MSDDFSLEVGFTKRNEDLRLVAGFAYVSKRNGVLMHDTQGDSIDPEELRSAVHEFMKSRRLGIMHIKGPDGVPIEGGEIVEMAVLAGDFRPPGMKTADEGLWIVAKVSQEAWPFVKSGDFRGFSIGGKGIREEIK